MVELATTHCEPAQALGYQPELLYNIALCSYKTKQFGPALKNLADIIQKAVQEHPELGVGRCAPMRAPVRPENECPVVLQAPALRQRRPPDAATCLPTATRTAWRSAAWATARR
jgi:hypothetical protein